MKHLFAMAFVATLAVGCQSKKDAPKNTEGSAKASTDKTTPASGKATPAGASAAAPSASTPASTPASPASAGPNQWYCYKMEEFGECQSSLTGPFTGGLSRLVG